MSQLSVDIMENGMVHKLAQLLWNYNKSYKIIYYSCTVLSKKRYKKINIDQNRADRYKLPKLFL